MKRWWTLWSGHVFLALTALSLLVTGYLAWAAARSEEAGAMFSLFLYCLLAFFVTLIIGAVAAWRFKTPTERYYLDHEMAMGEPRYERAGRTG